MTGRIKYDDVRKAICELWSMMLMLWDLEFWDLVSGDWNQGNDVYLYYEIRQKPKEQFDFSLTFFWRSFFLPHPAFPTGAQPLCSATAKCLLC